MRVTILSFVVLTACNAHEAPRTPEETCVASCVEHAPRCRDDECSRGCNLSIDRLIEREGDRVIECVARTNACDDPAWAKCATRIGAHADGGPPGPPPPPPED